MTVEEVVAVAADDVEGLEVFGLVQLPGQEVGVAQDGRHGRADLVAHVGQELALGAGRRFGGRIEFLHGLPLAFQDDVVLLAATPPPVCD